MTQRMRWMGWCIVGALVMSLLSACGGLAMKVITDPSKVKTTLILPGNLLETAVATKPAWVNPGVDIFKNGERRYFVELRTESFNTPMKLVGARFVLGASNIEVGPCSGRQDKIDNEGNTRRYVEWMYCGVSEDFHKKVANFPTEVRVIFVGTQERGAVINDLNKLHFKRFVEEASRAKIASAP